MWQQWETSLALRVVCLSYVQSVIGKARFPQIAVMWLCSDMTCQGMQMAAQAAIRPLLDERQSFEARSMCPSCLDAPHNSGCKLAIWCGDILCVKPARPSLSRKEIGVLLG